MGKIIEIGSEPFTVVGVIRQASDSLPNMDSPNEFYNYYESIMGTVLIPNKCWAIPYKFDEPENAIYRVDSTDNMSAAGSAVAKILNKSISSTNTNSSSNLKYKADDVMQRVQDLQKLSESTNSQLIWICKYFPFGWRYRCYEHYAGICNRAYQGDCLKKAIGARKKTILNQFLTEAAVLTSVGGIIGVILGIGLSKVVSKVAGSPTAISVPAIVGSVVFSMLIGIIFGLLPSVKAANLNPIDALRSE